MSRGSSTRRSRRSSRSPSEGSCRGSRGGGEAEDAAGPLPRVDVKAGDGCRRSMSMLMCDTAEALVVREADGLLAPAELAGLEAHAAGCEACRALRAANLAVKRAMALRTDAMV